MKRCSGITAKQTRCQRKVGGNQSFCYQHRGQAEEKKSEILPVVEQKNEVEIIAQVKPKRAMYMRKTKCFLEGCGKDITDRGVEYLYCADHTCVFPECKYFVSDKGRYCLAHKCYLCGEIKVEGSNHCSTHKCQFEGCKKAPAVGKYIVGGKYCDEHACQFKRCKNQKDASSRGGNYCSEHKKQYALEKPEECPICLESLDEKEQPWPCGHYVHKNCIVKGMKPECPLCREKLPLYQSDLRIIENNRREFRERQGLLIGGDPEMRIGMLHALIERMINEGQWGLVMQMIQQASDLRV
jgi:Ring finger domain